MRKKKQNISSSEAYVQEVIRGDSYTIRSTFAHDGFLQQKVKNSGEVLGVEGGSQEFTALLFLCMSIFKNTCKFKKKKKSVDNPGMNF